LIPGFGQPGSSTAGEVAVKTEVTLEDTPMVNLEENTMTIQLEDGPGVKPEETPVKTERIDDEGPQFSNGLITDAVQVAAIELAAPQPVEAGAVSDPSFVPERPPTPPPPQDGTPLSPRGVKRKVDEVMSEVPTPDEEDEPADASPMKRRVNPDGTVDQEDTVKLWEPGYKERYYLQKFGVSLPDEEFRKQIAKSYIEGLCWVLRYYYQGTPSWHWFYPYHFSPFASDFIDVGNMDITFDDGTPSKPFEQLMGVFPAASRHLIPGAFRSLMTDEDSPILDFYPTDFDIDMNGKRMLWQGVALLPFIDRKRLLDAMELRYPLLSEDEVRRNKWGENDLFVGDGHPMFDFLSGLYTKRKHTEPKVIDPTISKGISGLVRPDENWLPQSTYYAPEALSALNMPDIQDNKAMSSHYSHPEQTTPHRSVLLDGVKRARPTLTPADQEQVRRGGNRGRGRDGGGPGMSGERYTAYGGYSNGPPPDRHGYGRGNYNSRNSYPPPQPMNQPRYPPHNHSRPPPPSNAYGYGYRPPPPLPSYGRGSGYSDGYGDGGYGQGTYGYGGVNGYGGPRSGPPPSRGGPGARGGYGGGGDRGGYGRDYRDPPPFGRGRGRGRY
jgi:5'-3' exoribonuclease 2